MQLLLPERGKKVDGSLRGGVIGLGVGLGVCLGVGLGVGFGGIAVECRFTLLRINFFRY